MPREVPGLFEKTGGGRTLHNPRDGVRAESAGLLCGHWAKLATTIKSERETSAAGDAGPSEATVKRPIAGYAVAIAVFALAYAGAIQHLVGRWSAEADYSHGFFVPVFAAFLLWHRRGMLDPSAARGGQWAGLVLLILSGALRLASTALQYRLIDPASMIPCLAGLVLLLLGWSGLRWSWPAILFLVFMIPLPGFIAGQLGHPLQRVGTIASTYVLQTLGIPATASGNVIWLSEGKIGVVEACNGIRMLTTFFAITVGAFFVLDRPLWERAIVVLSAPAIAVLANVTRISATGVAYELFGQEVGDMIFHDLAGWLMMPLAILLLMALLAILSRLLPETPEGPVVDRPARTPERAIAR